MIDSILNYPLVNGRTLGDLLSLEFLVSVTGDILAAIVILVVGYTIAGWVNARISAIAQRHPSLDETLFNFLGNLARYAVLIFAFIFVLNTFGVQTTSIVAVIGAAGLAIGLALQGTLSNVAAGVMLILFRPIKAGDFVQVSDQMGTVKSINLNFTELADLSNVQIIVPNAQVWGNTIVNYSVYDRRRAEWTFGVAYGADLRRAEQVIRETIMADPRSLKEPEPFLQVNNLGDFSVDFLVRVWVASADYFQYQADIKRRVKEELDRAGIEIPFPTRTIHANARTQA